ncbi:putative amidotransferase subunit A [Podospora australis]|uniref:Amidotransferase subunit A n=1 Tax=Podospora australis TaxID=1536484 RepID=A0AAN7AF54_9PEZI|nr:putative amidotransferase subunit A [Podospora australis]
MREPSHFAPHSALIDRFKSAISQIARTKNIHLVHIEQPESSLSQGPYFLHCGSLQQAYRLYPDTAGAFVVATVPVENNHGSFRSLDASAYGEDYPSTLTVAVPSRLYFKKTDGQPYARLRLAIKDIIDLTGLKTGASSRAYTALHPPRSTTAQTIQRLIDLGFVIVGKLKTTQFADSEWPTSDWVDYHAPFNPRRDGYLTTSGSNAGSAAAVAAYDWLDISIGTDTLGSIRAPVAAQGVFGMRSSLDAASFSGIVPYSPRFVTIGGFARTASEFKALAEALYGPGRTTTKPEVQKPTKILYPSDYWPVQNGPSQELFDAFIGRPEDYLGVKRTALSLEKLWEQHRPDGIWNGLFRDFLPEYEARFGKPPVLNPQLRFKIEYLPSITPEQQAEAVRRLKVYQGWFYEHAMPPADEQGNVSSPLVLPWTTGEPDYRDRDRNGPQRFTGTVFFFYNIGPYAEAPELIITGEAFLCQISVEAKLLTHMSTVGSTPYISKFTGRTERLPAALGLLGNTGSDVALARLVSDMLESLNGGEAEVTVIDC